MFLFLFFLFFFFNDTATTEIYTLSLHDALPVSSPGWPVAARHSGFAPCVGATAPAATAPTVTVGPALMTTREAPVRSPTRAASSRRGRTMPSGERLVLELDPAGGPSLRVEWDVGALRELAARQQPGSGDGAPTWRLEREPDWERAGAVRLISATFDDGALLGVAALRPQGAAGHDADVIGAILI